MYQIITPKLTNTILCMIWKERLEKLIYKLDIEHVSKNIGLGLFARVHVILHKYVEDQLDGTAPLWQVSWNYSECFQLCQ